MIYIVGAGLAGLLAANMLAKHKPSVLEAQPSLPNNHSAVLRFRSSIVGDVLGIPFKRVSMIKATQLWKNPVADALAYARKNGGISLSDRSITQGLVTEPRYIAPPNLIALMARQAMDDDVVIQMEAPFTRDFMIRNERGELLSSTPIISTIPMPALMEVLAYPRELRPVFDFTSGFNIRAKVGNCDAYASLLVPDPRLPFSRISLTGDEIIVECIGKDEFENPHLINTAAEMLGLRIKPDTVTFSQSRYQKINPTDETKRRQFIHWATDRYQVYSLGRFATWRPGLLLDDLVQDINLIKGWMNDSYALKKGR